MFEIKGDYLGGFSSHVWCNTKLLQRDTGSTKRTLTFDQKTSVTSEYLIWQYPKGVAENSGQLGTGSDKNPTRTHPSGGFLTLTLSSSPSTGEQEQIQQDSAAKLRPQLQVTSLLSVWLSVLGLVLRSYSWFLDFPSLHILLHPFGSFMRHTKYSLRLHSGFIVCMFLHIYSKSMHTDQT